MKEAVSTLKAFGKDWKILTLAGALSFGFVSLVSFLNAPQRRTGPPSTR